MQITCSGSAVWIVVTAVKIKLKNCNIERGQRLLLLLWFKKGKIATSVALLLYEINLI